MNLTAGRPAITNHDSTMNSKIHQLLQQLEAITFEKHHGCEDRWYSCPKHPDGCSDDQFPKDVCNCGADQRNAEVSSLIKEIRQELATAPEPPRFTTAEIRAYIEGWALAPSSIDRPSYATLHNALLMLDDPQDGIAAARERGAL